MSENLGYWTMIQRVLTQLWDEWPKCLSENKTGMYCVVKDDENEQVKSVRFNIVWCERRHTMTRAIPSSIGFRCKRAAGTGVARSTGWCDASGGFRADRTCSKQRSRWNLGTKKKKFRPRRERVARKRGRLRICGCKNFSPVSFGTMGGGQ